MAYQLPGHKPTCPRKGCKGCAPGPWAARVRLPNGQRVFFSDRLKGRVEAWAADLKGDVRRGDWMDPRAGDTTVGECWQRWSAGRRLEKSTRARDAAHWCNHVGPRWGDVPVGSIFRPDVDLWVRELEAAHRRGCVDRKCAGCRLAAETIGNIVGVLRSALHLAVDARLIRANPALGVKVPPRPAADGRVLAPHEDALLLDAADRLFPDRPDARLACELMLYCGLRWEEMGGLRRDAVDLRRAILHIGPVLERDGTIRPYPKSPAGVRPVPVDRQVWPRVRARAMAVGQDDVLVCSPRGGVLDYHRWYHRVWRRILDGAELVEPITPHDLRHTYCTRLGEQGMPAHELMALSGHAKLASVQRYLHAGDGRHDRARDAIERARRG